MKMRTKFQKCLNLTISSLVLVNGISTDDYEGYIGHCNTSVQYIWSEAQQYCETNYGTTLASIHSDSDVTAFRAARASSTWGTWTGLQIINGTFEWMDGSSYDYDLQWWYSAPDNTTNGCVHLHGSNWDFDYGNCHTYWRYCFICWNNSISSPTGRPSVLPSFEPTAQPTFQPTAQPTPQPTFKPKSQPTMFPTSSPTNNPSILPTASPTAPAAQTYEFIDSGDITFETIESQSYTDTYFNPGYYNLLYSQISLNLDSSKKTDLFEAWLENPDDFNIDITPKWRVYDVTNTESEILNLTGSCSSNLIQTTSSLEQDNDLAYTDEDKTTATFTIYSYCVLYSDVSVNEYSASTICSAYDQTYFTSGNTFKFENTVEISASWEQTQQDGTSTSYSGAASSTSSFNMVANTPPDGARGTCTVSPSTGFALETVFNFSCSGWTDSETQGSNAINTQFNFIKDRSSSFLRTYYTSGDNWASTTFSVGNQSVTAVIIDNLTLATCETLYVTVEEPAEFTESVENFTSWVTETYTTSVEDILSSSAEDADQGLASAMSVLETAYEVSVDYSDQSTGTTDATESSSSELVELQESIISTALSVATSLDVDTEAEAIVVLEALTEITVPIVTRDDVGEDSEVYTSSTLSSILSVLSEVVVDTLSEASTDSSVVSSDTAESVFETLSNVQEMRRVCNEGAASARENGDRMAGSTTTMSGLLLKQSVVGESYQFKTETLNITASKISALTGHTGCTSNGAAGVDLSDELLNRRSNNGEDHMDCTVMNTEDNIYDTQNGDSEYATFYSTFVLIDVTADTADTESGRRRLANGNSSDYLSSCEPIIISFESSNVDFNDFEQNYPTCSFYNETTESYEGDGCYVIYSDELTGAVQCACLHLTVFGITAEDFAPEINYVNLAYLKQDISWQTFVLYPLGWVFCLVWFAVCVLLILLFHKGSELEEKFEKKIFRDIEDVPLMVQQTALFSDFGADTSKRHDVYRYRSVKEIKVILNDDDEDTEKPYCLQLYQLWRIALRNDHLWFGIYFRNNGTFYDSTQRIAVMMVRLLTTMAVSALFYGISKDSTVGDISLSFYESILGFIPMFFLTRLIQKRRPSPEEIRKFDIGVKDRLASLDSATLDAQDKIKSLQQHLDIASDELRNQRREHLLQQTNFADKYPILFRVYAAIAKTQRRPSQLKRVKTEKLVDALANETKLRKFDISALRFGFVSETRQGHRLHQSTASRGSTISTANDTELVFSTEEETAGETAGVEKKKEAPQTGDSQSFQDALESAVTRSEIATHRSRAALASGSAGTVTTVTKQNNNAKHSLERPDVEDGAGETDIVYRTGTGVSVSNISAASPASTANVSIVSATSTVDKDKTEIDKIQVQLNILNELRLRLFDSTFKYPPWIKWVTDGIIAVWSIGCAIITTLWVMWFDQELNADNNVSIASECPDSIDISEQIFLNFNETQAYLDSVSGVYKSYYVPPENDSWGDNLDASARFMSSVLVSYVIAAVVWQPIILFFKSMYKLRKLHKHTSQHEAVIYYHPERLINWNKYVETMQLCSDGSSGGASGTRGARGAGDLGGTEEPQPDLYDNESDSVGTKDLAKGAKETKENEIAGAAETMEEDADKEPVGSTPDGEVESPDKADGTDAKGEAGIDHEAEKKKEKNEIVGANIKDIERTLATEETENVNTGRENDKSSERTA